MRILFIAVFFSGLVVLLVATRPSTQAQLQPTPPTAVAVTSVRQQDVEPLTVKTGRLQPSRRAELRFEVSGRVIARHVEPGQRVEAGDALLAIEKDEYEDAVREAEALVRQEQQAIERDQKLLDLAIREREIQEREVNRLERLGRESLASESASDDAVRRLLRNAREEAQLRFSVESAEARLDVRQASLNRARRNLERTTLEAPFAGTVNTVNREEGDHVSTGQVAVELVQTDTLDLYLEVTGGLAAVLSLQQQVPVILEQGQRTGTIVALAVKPDPLTNTYPLRIRLDGKGLLPGRLARAELREPVIRNALTIPDTSVLQEGGDSHVYRVEDNRLAKTRVTLERRFRDRWVVAGVEPGATIVADDVAALADGQEVTPR